MTPLERAARALLASESNNEASWDDLDVLTRSAFLRDARAVLTAIREPSEAMLKDAGEVTFWHLPEDQEESEEVALSAIGYENSVQREVWETMIDSALADIH